MLLLLLLLFSGRVYLLSQANATAVLRIAQKNVMVHLSRLELLPSKRGFQNQRLHYSLKNREIFDHEIFFLL